MGDEGRSKHREKDRGHSHSHRHRDDEDRHHRKKRRRDDEDRERHRHKSHKRHESREREKEKEPVPEKSLADELADDFDEDMWEEKPAEPSVTEEIAPKVERQSWMTGEKSDDKADPFSSLFGAPAKEKKPVEQPKPQGLVISSRELNTGLLNPPSPSSEDEDKEDKYTPPTYTIGDSGSSWRMMKLKNLYTAAKEAMRPVEEIAVERLGSLRAFDEAREEEQELERRKRDRRGEGVLKVKVTGELYQKRLAKEEKDRKRQAELYPPQKPSIPNTATVDPSGHPVVTQSDLNRLQAALLRAEMTSSPDAGKLAQEYEVAVKQFNTQPAAPEVIVLPASHSTLLPHLSREQSKSETEMTIEDMVREERASKRTTVVDRIARDRKFKNDLDYMDENAERLAAAPKRKEIDLKSMSVQDYKKQQRIVDNCPLCYKDDGRMPLAPVISLGTRVYLSLPTEPELTSDGAIIVPIRHARNLADCDDDEWEEIRNFMKCLMQMYGNKGQSVLFYEDASHPSLHRHPALIAIPMPPQYFDQAPAYFTQALNTAESEWATHRPIVHTNTPELGKWGFRKRIAKEAPYFHVWFSLEGGMGHIIEDEEKWGNGEMWVRSVLGAGLLEIERTVWGRMGRWTGHDKRVDGFKRKWDKFDWTKALTVE